MHDVASFARRVAAGERLDAAALATLGEAPLAALMAGAARLRDNGFGPVVTVSRKVFIPLTKLCRNVCHYCTFAHPPRPGEPIFLSREEVLEIARAGAAAGCDEALFTLGDKPEMRYRAAREALAALGHETTVAYLAEMAAAVLAETGLLPHINAGVMSEDEIAALRRVSASQGIMVEATTDRLMQRGMPHFGSPDKAPAVRLATIAAAGRAKVPFTSGILIGLGETRQERIDAFLKLRDLHEEHGHIQEIIVQNFRAKAGTKMANAPEPALEDHLWTIAMARFVFGPAMSIQAPPNLRDGDLLPLVEAGINDWGGVSPVTPDHVNPEAPWPALARLAAETAAAGKILTPRLTAYPAYVADAETWIDPDVRRVVLSRSDGAGLAHEGAWRVGRSESVVTITPQGFAAPALGSALAAAIDAGVAGRPLEESAIVALLCARGGHADAVGAAADAVRRERNGDTVSYVVTRNINYTNVCGYGCQFCAFSKGKAAEHLRGRPYDLTLEEIERRVVEAHERGATEVCMQGGIHPDYTGETYLEIVRTVKRAVPEMHVHAFSPLEVTQGARTLGLSVAEFLSELKAAGLGTLPGTAAEILDDEVRRRLCATKVSTDEWLDVVGTAHRLGLRTTATIMFGHVEAYHHVARHLMRVRALQDRTGGFTEFVPLPFVHMEAPIYLKGAGARQGPSLREAVLIHAVSRLALNPVIANIQVSWVKMGEAGIAAALEAGANDLGGTLMNESISRAAGTEHGQEMPPERMEAAIRRLGRTARQRTTLYGDAPAVQQRRAFQAPPLSDVVNTAAAKLARVGSARRRAGA
ncbi:5-amino-6-(D-ribitylamino)uracil--L-tyrosine 4-hydroxyphenyl transferase CofH [Acuticoccus mangrovi]|uniref:FO synthase n=1 Tax=Acuticoccus mangrovi TaxID=2796142 RepID=A0A934IQV9_9HYPH|nr:5-amino-6-(D-ribitylamino)uracil--L-tyrosine 4-hydroxyphenyl transferase CofH [Acuticoccus mangrovi]MBJ3776617.1 5-amino-6-(D-ribitylamino)uracil--L-tyrosine 4-hydroxyphenyl transferase CofH [Acuticoccus mangrovi]